MELPAYLKVMADKGASDLFFSTGSPVMMKVEGKTGPITQNPLASMIDHRNGNQSGHILTLEDPIEYTHNHRKSVVNQREVGVDTRSYNEAMREAPDVIMIGEIRDRDTMKHALTYAETGHLCISTLHASNVDHTMRRIVNFFPEHAHKELFMDMSMHLKAVIAQRLLKGKDGKRVVAVEVMLASPYIRDLINKGEIDGIADIMTRGTEHGMKTFDQAILELYDQGKISQEEALNNANSRHNLEVKIRLASGGLHSQSDLLSIDES